MNYPIEAPKSAEAILFRLDQLGINKSELSRPLVCRSRASEMLKGKRKLSNRMIKSAMRN